MPDFVLFMRQKSGETLTYQLFIEPKGKQIKENDRWKADFLTEITQAFQGRAFSFDNTRYRLVGVPFYNNEDENQFRAGLEAVLKETRLTQWCVVGKLGSHCAGSD